MRRLLLVTVVGLVFLNAYRVDAQGIDTERIVAMERAALDRWGKGDPQGYLEIMAPEVTYFDPDLEARLDGLPAMRALLVPLTGKIKIARYEMLKPSVQQHGNVALLTFNLLCYQNGDDGKERLVARWNSTEVYARLDGRWRIIHSHWSYIKPDVKQPAVGES